MNNIDKLKQIITNATALSQTKINIVIFRDDPWLYVQYYLGLYFEMPTVIIIRKQDRQFISRLQHPLVKKIFEVDDFTEATSEETADKIAEFVNAQSK